MAHGKTKTQNETKPKLDSSWLRTEVLTELAKSICLILPGFLLRPLTKFYPLLLFVYSDYCPSTVTASGLIL